MPKQGGSVALRETDRPAHAAPQPGFRAAAVGAPGDDVPMAGPEERVPLVGRLDELERLAGLVGLTSRRAATRERRPALRRRRRRQDPAARRAAHPRRAGRLPRPRRALPRLRRQRAALPPVQRGLRPAGRRLPHPGPLAGRGRPRHRPADARPPRDPRAPRARRRQRPPGPARPLRVRARRARAARPGRAAAAADRGRPLGRPVHPRAAQLPVLPTLRLPGGRGRVLPQRRPAPPPPAAHRSRRVGPAARRHPHRAGPARRRRRPHPGRDAAPRAAARARHARHRRARRGQRVLHRGARAGRLAGSRCAARGPRRPAAGAARPARRRRPPGGPGRRGRPAAGSPTCCSSGSWTGRSARLDSALRAAVERNVLLPMGRDGYAFRHALLAEAVYDDLLPGERVRLHAAYAKALQQGGVGGTAAELAKHARAANDVATAARASIAAGDEAMAVAGPDEASRHYELALELATDSGLDDIDVVELTARACEAALAAGQTYRALALARDQLRATSPDTSPQARLRLLHVKATVAIVADTEGRRAEGDHRGASRCSRSTRTTRCAPSCSRCTPARCPSSAAHDEATEFATEAAELADRLGLAVVVADARTTLARLRERPGETAASRAMLEETVGQARAGRRPGRRAAQHVQPRHAAVRGRRHRQRPRRVRPDPAPGRGDRPAVVAVRAGVPGARHPGRLRARRLGRCRRPRRPAPRVAAGPRRGDAGVQRPAGAGRPRRRGRPRGPARAGPARPAGGDGRAVRRVRGGRPARRPGRPPGRHRGARRHRRDPRRDVGEQELPGPDPAVRPAARPARLGGVRHRQPGPRRPGRPRRRPAGCRPPGCPGARAVGLGGGAGGPRLAGPGRGRARPAPLAGRRGRTRARRAGRPLGARRDGVRGVRSRLRAGPLAGPAGRGAAPRPGAPPRPPS